MSTIHLAAAGARPRDADVRAAPTDFQLRRFAPRYHAGIAAAAERHPRLADLAFSFPALLFALTIRRSGIDADAAIDAVIRGESLKRAAGLAGLPLWLRKLPPEAFQGPIPGLPDGDMFRRQIMNHLPNDRRQLWPWLHVLSFCGKWSGPGFAAWAAREYSRSSKARRRWDWPVLCLWSWHSLHTNGKSLLAVDKPWKPCLAIEPAAEAAMGWMNEFSVALGLRCREAPSHCFEAAEIDGYTFMPMASASALAEEAAFMENCIMTYGSELLEGRAEFWSVRRNGSRIGVLNIERSPRNPIPHIAEFTGKKNSDVGREAWLVAAKWLVSQDLVRQCSGTPVKETEYFDGPLWRRAWRDYWLDRRCVPSWLPLSPNQWWTGCLTNRKLAGWTVNRRPRRRAIEVS